MPATRQHGAHAADLAGAGGGSDTQGSSGARGSALPSALGVLGEILVTLGVLVGLYVVWQVWWTGVEAKGETEQALTAINEQMAPPVAAEAPPTQVFTPDRKTPPAARVDAHGGIGILHVPVWGEDHAAPILEGTTEAVLATGGAGHYEGTAMAGEIGNFSVAGHRLTRGNPFLHIDELAPGDPVVVETAEAWLVYEVVADEIVPPTDVDVILPVPRQPTAEPTAYLMTLTTCHPVTSRSHRWITHLELSHWTPRDAGVPAELAAGAQGDTAALAARGER